MGQETTETKTPGNARAIVGGPREREYTLDTLGPLLGTFPEGVRTALFEVTTEEQLWRRGKSVESGGILTDAPLFLGSAYDIWQALSEAQRMKVNIDPQVFAVCHDECLTLRRLAEGYGLVTAVTAGGRAGRKSEMRQATREIRALRRSLLDSLRDALAPAARAEVLTLVGSVRKTALLVSGSERLADHVTGLVERSTENEKVRLRAFNITAQRATELLNKVAEVRAATTVTATPARRVDQRKLDIQDGRVLHLMRRILRAFRAARREDPSILLPEVRALAGILTTAARASRAKPGSTPPSSGPPPAKTSDTGQRTAEPPAKAKNGTK